MYAEERQHDIADQVAKHGRASVNDLANRFAVTSETIRRDLAQLERDGYLRRVHGGAVPVRSARIAEIDVNERSLANPMQKTRIGEAASRFVPTHNGSLIIDAGTTTIQAATHLPNDRDLVVFTNSVSVAAVVATRLTASNNNVDLHMIGGRVRGLTQAAVGTGAVTVLRSLRVDTAFIGTNGLTLDHGLATPDPDEAAVKAAMISAANRVVVLADSSKVDRDDLVSFGSLGDIDVLITDDGINPHLAAQLTDKGIEVVTA